MSTRTWNRRLTAPQCSLFLTQYVTQRCAEEAPGFPMHNATLRGDLSSMVRSSGRAAAALRRCAPRHIAARLTVRIMIRAHTRTGRFITSATTMPISRRSTLPWLPCAAILTPITSRRWASTSCSRIWTRCPRICGALFAMVVCARTCDENMREKRGQERVFIGHVLLLCRRFLFDLGRSPGDSVRGAENKTGQVGR